MVLSPPTLFAFPPAVAAARWTPLAIGGYSGATVFRADTGFALKCWPVGFAPARLRQIHAWMAAVRLPFVPEVIADRAGDTVVVSDGRSWDVTTWMPGEASFHREPTEAKLRSVSVALATIHARLSLSHRGEGSQPIPAVARRLQLLAEWHAADASHSHPLLAAARELVRTRHADTVRRLREWETVPLALRPCLCDVWHDHLLFTGDTLTGLIDYGAMKVDTPAVDLARMLGDLVGTAHPWFALGLRFYREANPAFDAPDEFVALLADTGDVCAVANWLIRWPALPPGPARDAAADRLRGLVGRPRRAE